MLDSFCQGRVAGILLLAPAPKSKVPSFLGFNPRTALTVVQARFKAEGLCFMPTRKSLVGQRFSRLLVLAQTYPNGTAECLVICVCGTVKTVRAGDLGNGKQKSCGCLRNELSLARLTGTRTTHGLHKSPEHVSWSGLKQRCLNPKNTGYDDYGGRGISVCIGIRTSFEFFLAKVGRKPTPSHSIDRRNNEGHYSCGECSECLTKGWPFNLRWASKSQQVNNRRKLRERLRDSKGRYVAR